MIETGAEKMSKSDGNIFQLSRGARPLRARGGRRLPDLRPLPAAVGLRGGADGAGGCQGRAAAELLPEHPIGEDREGGGGVPGEAPSEQQRGGSAGTSPGARLDAFRDALADDFNTPRAMAEAFELVGDANRGEVPGASEALREMLGLVGLGSLAEAEVGADDEAEGLLAERDEARLARDFGRADADPRQAGGAGLGSAGLG